MSGVGEALLVCAGIVLLITLWCAASLFADRGVVSADDACAAVQSC
jgi:hypothetical protein